MCAIKLLFAPLVLKYTHLTHKVLTCFFTKICSEYHLQAIWIDLMQIACCPCPEGYSLLFYMGGLCKYLGSEIL